MATADDALNVARSYLGEGPDRFIQWYPAPNGTAWCCIFQSYVASQIGIPTHYAWVSSLFDKYRSERRTFAPREAQPGDLVAFDYDGSGPSSYDHIAMVESVDDRGITAINGNWTNKVCRVLHRWDTPGYSGGIAEIARPPYAVAPQPSPEEDEMKSVVILGKDGTYWHVFGNTRVALSSVDEVNLLAFLGAQVINDRNDGTEHWLHACAIIPRNGGINTPGK